MNIFDKLYLNIYRYYKVKKNLNADDFAANFVSAVQIFLIILTLAFIDIFIDHYSIISLNKTKIGIGILLVILFLVNDKFLKRRYRELTDSELEELCNIETKYIPYIMILIPSVFLALLISISILFK